MVSDGFKVVQDFVHPQYGLGQASEGRRGSLCGGFLARLYTARRTHGINSSLPYCGWTKSCTTWKPWETIVCWYLQKNQIIPGVLRWCRISSIHSSLHVLKNGLLAGAIGPSTSLSIPFLHFAPEISSAKQGLAVTFPFLFSTNEDCQERSQ